MVIQDYIKKSRDAGLSDDQIRQALMKAGWQANAIEQSLSGKINQSTQPSTAGVGTSSARVIQSTQKLARRGKNILHRWWFYFILIVVISLPVGYYFLNQKSAPIITPVQNNDSGYAIVISNQVILEKVHIDKVTTEEPSFLAIQTEDTVIAGLPNPNNVLANTNLLNPDTYENFDLSATGKDLSERLSPGVVLVATLYKDANSNRYYDLFADTEPVLNASGEKVRIIFYAK